MNVTVNVLDWYDADRHVGYVLDMGEHGTTQSMIGEDDGIEHMARDYLTGMYERDDFDLNIVMTGERTD